MDRQGQWRILGDPGLVVRTASPPTVPEGHFRAWLFPATGLTCPVLRGRECGQGQLSLPEGMAAEVSSEDGRAEAWVSSLGTPPGAPLPCTLPLALGFQTWEGEGLGSSARVSQRRCPQIVRGSERGSGVLNAGVPPCPWAQPGPSRSHLATGTEEVGSGRPDLAALLAPPSAPESCPPRRPRALPPAVPVHLCRL